MNNKGKTILFDNPSVNSDQVEPDGGITHACSSSASTHTINENMGDNQRDHQFFETPVHQPAHNGSAGRAFRISGFMCIPTSNWQQTLENRTSLSFTRFSKFDAIPADGFPDHYFNFVSYNRLPYKVVDPKDNTRKEYPVLTGNSNHALWSDTRFT